MMDFYVGIIQEKEILIFVLFLNLPHNRLKFALLFLLA